MDAIVVTSIFFVISLVLIGEIKKVELAKKVGIYLLTIVSIIYYLSSRQDEIPNNSLIAISILYISLAYLSSFLRKINVWARLVLPLVFTLLFVFVNQELKVGEYVISFHDYKVLLFIILAYLLFFITKFKSNFLVKHFHVNEANSINFIQIILVSIFVYLAYFFHAEVGILLITLGVAAATFSHNEKNNVLLSLLFLLSSFSFMNAGDYHDVQMVYGKNIAGFMLGAGLLLFHKTMFSALKKKWIAYALALFAVSAIVFGFTFLGTQKNDFGGRDMFLCFLFGMSLLSFFVKEHFSLSILYGEMLVIGMLVFPAFNIEDLTIEEEKCNVNNQVVIAIDPFSAPALPLNEIVGAYKISTNKQVLNFELGPVGGRTKGKFTSFEGEVEITQDLVNSKFLVKLPVKSLSTMNRFRDEELMGETYFNEGKFKMMSFESTGIIEKTSHVYEVNGEFTMLGKKLNQTFELKRVSSDANPKLIGKGKIDRTKFGMTPDPKEGNVVDFYFEIELEK